MSDEIIVEKTDLNCPDCSAPLKFEKGDRVVKCDYCGNTVHLHRKKVVEEEEEEEEDEEEVEVVGECSVCGVELTDNDNVDYRNEIKSAYRCKECKALLCYEHRRYDDDLYITNCPTCWEKNAPARAHRKRVKTAKFWTTVIGLLGTFAGSFYLMFKYADLGDRTGIITNKFTVDTHGTTHFRFGIDRKVELEVSGVEYENHNVGDSYKYNINMKL